MEKVAYGHTPTSSHSMHEQILVRVGSVIWMGGGLIWLPATRFQLGHCMDGTGLIRDPAKSSGLAQPSLKGHGRDTHTYTSTTMEYNRTGQLPPIFPHRTNGTAVDGGMIDMMCEMNGMSSYAFERVKRSNAKYG